LSQQHPYRAIPNIDPLNGASCDLTPNVIVSIGIEKYLRMTMHKLENVKFRKKQCLAILRQVDML